MGKTVTCQRLAVLLDRRRQQDPTGPLPLYLDLRHLTGLDRRVPTLAEIVEECMARGWDLAEDGGSYRFAQFQGWVAQGAVVVFDGLDEVLVKLKAADGQTFTQELLRLLPGARARRPADAAGGRAVKLLISCRTHYFRTLRDQKTHFTGQERGEHGAASYRALVLLPLTAEQVRRYLAAALFPDGAGPGAAESDAQIERILETVRSVHNLTELTQRPYTLRLVAEFIPEIEQDRLAGRPVYGVTLYRRMVRRWLERDGGKHHILPEHKLLLATHLAAHLWQSGAGLLPADGIERWFRAWLKTEPDLLERYRGVHRDQLDEDLRTATFLVRQDHGPSGSGAGTVEGGGFRFAHTSLLEFFLANSLLEAIRDNTPDRWALPRPSPQTLDFLGQLLAEAADPGLLVTLGGWRAPYRAQTSELLLAYALRAHAHGWPQPPLAGIVLVGARLDEWQFGSASGVAKGRPSLDLSGADFSGCNLRRARFDGVRLTGARLCDSQLAQAEFLRCDCTGADWAGAECSGAIWRYSDLAGGHWNGARGAGPRFLHCAPYAASPAAAGDATTDYFTAGTAFERSQLAPAPWLANPGLPLRWLIGHQGWVMACAFAPDGTRLLSAGSDGTLRLWDAASGATLRTLIGHEGRVTACAFAPDGTRLLSAGVDGTLRLWDATTGAPLLTLTGREEDGFGWVVACAFAPDGTRLLSADGDRTLRLWDVASGAALLTMTADQGGVVACAFAAGGTRLLSVGFDGTLRLWDAASGAVTLTLPGHEGDIAACVFDPDNARIFSAGYNGTLRLWDIADGETLLTLTGHQGRVGACAFAPDGTRLLSAGDDGTLRIWDAGSGAALLALTSHENAVTACAFAPDGTRLLCAGRDGILRLWDAANGAALLTLNGHQGSVNACAFAPDGTRILSAGADGTLRLWDATSGAALLTLTGHEDDITACAFSPDGTRLLSAGEDGTLRLWDAATGTPLRIHAIGRPDAPGHAVWDPNTNQLIEASGDAWRWLYWVRTGSDGWPEPLPLETFGPLPAPTRLRPPVLD